MNKGDSSTPNVKVGFDKSKFCFEYLLNCFLLRSSTSSTGSRWHLPRPGKMKWTPLPYEECRYTFQIIFIFIMNIFITMKSLKVAVAVVLSLGLLSAFIQLTDKDKPVPVPASPQRVGNPDKGYDYLINGDYIRSGIPYQTFLMGAGKSRTNYLQREGLNEKIPYEYTAVKAYNGKVVVAPNCLQCHAQAFEGKLYMGLGNTFIDFSNPEKLSVKKLQSLENVLKTVAPQQYTAAATFIHVTKTVGPYLTSQVQGVNMAGRLAAVLAAHRDPVTLAWKDQPLLPIPEVAIPTDTPPWWLLKKKNAMFYNGYGRGDFGRFLMASNLLTVNDTAESRSVDEHMPDLLAYLYSIEPPPYTRPINEELAATGKVIFNKSCSSCHGKYGEEESYPNLLIPQSIIRTDSLLYQSNYSNPQFVNWFNKSWFTSGDHPARLEAFKGYMAPPLDGIWITAPYLHNGSVPTLEALLNSRLRPRYWSRDFKNPIYDYEAIGWKFAEQPHGNTPGTYNTDLPGYGNYGHYFGDKLSDAERKAVIEYLKTL